MQFTFTTDETRLLLRHLGQWIEHLDKELVHTDKRELQHALALELDALCALTERLRSAAEPEAREARETRKATANVA